MFFQTLAFLVPLYKSGGYLTKTYPYIEVLGLIFCFYLLQNNGTKMASFLSNHKSYPYIIFNSEKHSVLYITIIYINLRTYCGKGSLKLIKNFCAYC